MEYFMIAIMVLFILGLLIGMYQMWTPDRIPTDYDLYGMSAEAYELKMMGDEEFKKYHSQQEYEFYKMELEDLENDNLKREQK